MVLILSMGCLFDSHNPEWEELYDPRCSEREEAVFGPTERYDSIQDALDDVDEDDTIELCPGQYTEALVAEKAVTILGRTTSGEVVIDADREGPVVFLLEGGVLQGLTLQGGKGFDNDGTAIGGGVLVAEGGVRLEDVVVRENKADHGAGLYLLGGGELTRVRVEGNEASSSGGGMVLAAGDFELTDVDVVDNGADAGGAFAAADADIAWEGGSMLGNEARAGTGLVLFEDCEVEAQDVETSDQTVYMQVDGDNAEEDLEGPDFRCTTRSGLKCD